MSVWMWMSVKHPDGCLDIKQVSIWVSSCLKSIIFGVPTSVKHLDWCPDISEHLNRCLDIWWASREVSGHPTRIWTSDKHCSGVLISNKHPCPASILTSVVKVFSLNRIISLAERQAFAHCCELLQVWGKMFSLQSRKAKIVCENVYICNFNIVWNLYWQMLCQFFANVCLNYYYYIMPLCYVQAQGIWILRLMLLPLIVWQMLFLAFLDCKEKIFPQTWRSSQQWAKACLSAKEIILFKEKTFTTL